MRAYRFLLFDADDTLLDFRRTERESVEKLLTRRGLCFTQERYDRYHRLNEGMWHALERGELDRQTLFDTRFALFFDTLGEKVDGPAVEAEFRALLDAGYALMPGALETVRALAPHFSLYLVTNGFSRTQRLRMEGAGLMPYFSGLFVSEEAGAPKPRPAFFSYAFSRIPDFDPKRALLIGDSPSSDMAGGIGAGIDTCFFSPSGAAPRAADGSLLDVTFCISSLPELVPLLLKAPRGAARP